MIHESICKKCTHYWTVPKTDRSYCSYLMSDSVANMMANNKKSDQDFLWHTYESKTTPPKEYQFILDHLMLDGALKDSGAGIALGLPARDNT